MLNKKKFMEKRVQPRIPVTIPLHYRPVESSPEAEKPRTHTAITQDLSLEGLHIQTLGNVKVGDIIQIDITIPGKSKNKLFAYSEVLWVKAKNAGLRLMLMPQEDRESLKNLLDAAASRV